MASPEMSSVLTRRKFASRYAHVGWGIALSAVGGLGVLGGLVNVLTAALAVASGNSITNSSGDVVGGAPLLVSAIVGLLVSVGLAVLGLYFLRGRGDSPGVVARRDAAERRRAEEAHRQAGLAASGMAQATAALAGAVGAGASVVAYRNLVQTAQHWHPADAQQRVEAATSSIGFVPSTQNSPRLGHLFTLDRQSSIEVFRDFIIWGQQAHDVDATTQGYVHVDGSIQVSSAVNNNKIVEQRHDMRRAELQFVGSGWSLSAPIHPDEAIEARKLVSQLASHVESLKPTGVTSADIRAMVDTIINNSGQPPAERVKQLSNLRFDRLLSDEEFERAKVKILGIS